MNFSPKNIAIIGASGALGSAFKTLLEKKYPQASLWAFSRAGIHDIDYRCEDSMAHAANLAAQEKPLDLVIVATGILHEGDVMPEKSLNDLSAEKFRKIFEVNTITPALVAKHFLPKLSSDNQSYFIVLSARVGSISDNQLGGWYAYRSSKAALNMVVKTAAIEMRRRNKKAIVASLHPGTVDSTLSKPFQANVPEGRLFTPAYAVGKMLDVLTHLSPQHSGKCFAWDGKEIAP